jgi:orotidine-5'-phosphate decarboxylase
VVGPEAASFGRAWPSMLDTIIHMPSPVIVSLDFDSSAEAMALVGQLGAESDHYKVGLQLLTGSGPQVVRDLTSQGKHVFLDSKLHEIPNSVASAVRAAGKLGVSMITIHASAGSAVLRAAVAAAEPYRQLKILGLTVITSLSDADLPEIGLAPSVKDQVLRLAALAGRAGCHGVVASAQEAAYLRSALPSSSLIVCPGIQLSAAATATDQARVASPAAAAKAGATHIVLGRAIASASEPAAAFRAAVQAFHNGV